MILTGNKIQDEVLNGRITINPFRPECINPNSYNFHLGSTFQVYISDVLDPKIEQQTTLIEMSEDGIVLQPNELYLGYTLEEMGSDYYVPFIFGRSSIGRLGLFVQITAPLGDIGFVGQWTLQLTPVRPVRVYPSMRIGQILFIVPDGPVDLYKGKYQYSQGARKSDVFKDFNKRT